MRSTALALMLTCVVLLCMGAFSPACAQGEAGAEGGGGFPLRLIVSIAAAWLLIMAAIAAVVVVTRRKAGEEDRNSREG